jgi:hypothetical protein
MSGLLGANHLLQKKAQNASPQYGSERFSRIVAISPPVISAYYGQAPNRGRELSFREAVLLLMYRVREDGLQTASVRKTHSASRAAGCLLLFFRIFDELPEKYPSA